MQIYYFYFLYTNYPLHNLVKKYKTTVFKAKAVVLFVMYRELSESVAQGEEQLMALVAHLHGVADVVFIGEVVVDVGHEG